MEGSSEIVEFIEVSLFLYFENIATIVKLNKIKINKPRIITVNLRNLFIE
ncbi:MAG: hypothetical protein CFH30_00176 [Alphaproteobacteria bacterium MarineAlpha8_Bin1]|nr:MAG: hypothetical protein CFH30_00176 [Alphaproteobacteria bacterium MarineAlpha8_Bin1]|tara:strand:+ start:30 stop:179 length:150 start_codon:yes stop_codon:yes gene_type:complete